MSKLIIANLDCEYQFGKKLTALPKKIRARISAAASLLRIFESDTLWTPAPLEAFRVPALEGLHMPNFISGDIPKTVEQTLVWGVTHNVNRCQTKSIRSTKIREAAWHCASTSPQASEQANDKITCFELQTRLGQTLPGSHVIQDSSQLNAIEFPERWILKPRFGVAGRGRVLGRNHPDADSVKRIEAALAQNGELIFEPWVQRVVDYGVTGFIDQDGVYGHQVHQLEVDGTGGFKGIRTQPENLDSKHEELLLKNAREAGKALRQFGYHGPFGIDAFVYRTADAELCLHAINEINARMTYGHIAQAYAEHLGEALALRFGPEQAPNSIGLLDADTSGSNAAWLVLGA